MNSIGIIDLGIGNINSLQKALRALHIESFVSADAAHLASADKLILPGVGSFAAASRALDLGNRREMLINLMRHKPLLGICVGMQILASVGLEHGRHSGLGVIPGCVDLIPCDNPLPHVGWNSVVIAKPSPLFINIPTGSNFYFTHSYAFRVDDESHSLAETTYGVNFASAVGRERVYGVQFHPEKSQQFGLMLLQNFVELG